GREHKVLQHLGGVRVDDLALDLDREDLLAYVGLDRYHAATRRRLDLLLAHLGLELLLLSLELPRLLHAGAEALHDDSPSSTVRRRTPTPSPWNALSAA